MLRLLQRTARQRRRCAATAWCCCLLLLPTCCLVLTAAPLPCPTSWLLPPLQNRASTSAPAIHCVRLPLWVLVLHGRHHIGSTAGAAHAQRVHPPLQRIGFVAADEPLILLCRHGTTGVCRITRTSTKCSSCAGMCMLLLQPVGQAHASQAACSGPPQHLLPTRSPRCSSTSTSRVATWPSVFLVARRRKSRMGGGNWAKRCLASSSHRPHSAALPGRRTTGTGPPSAATPAAAPAAGASPASAAAPSSPASAASAAASG